MRGSSEVYGSKFSLTAILSSQKRKNIFHLPFNSLRFESRRNIHRHSTTVHAVHNPAGFHTVSCSRYRQHDVHTTLAWRYRRSTAHITDRLLHREHARTLKSPFHDAGHRDRRETTAESHADKTGFTKPDDTRQGSQLPNFKEQRSAHKVANAFANHCNPNWWIQTPYPKFEGLLHSVPVCESFSDFENLVSGFPSLAWTGHIRKWQLRII